MKKVLLVLSLFSSIAWGKVEVVAFDCGGVLIQVDKDKYVNFVAKTFQLSSGDARAVLFRLKYAMDRGETPEAFWKKYALQTKKVLPKNWM